jgi:exodeoxyribonuclease-1
MRQAQPRLWDYALQLRDKRFAARLLDVTAMQPVLHVSQRYPASRLCAAPVLPLARHPRIDNRVVVFDLESDPAALLALAPDEIADRLYTPAADLPDGEQRIPLKEVHLNRAPALVAWSHLRPADMDRLGIDPVRCERHAEVLREAGPALAEKVRQVFAGERQFTPSDVDASLYDAFLADADKRRFTEVRTTPPALLGQRDFGFRDARLPELLFRYRARNWPGSLSPAERQRWDDYRRQRLATDSGMSEYSFASFDAELAELRMTHAADADRLALLDRIQQWRQDLQAGL